MAEPITPEQIDLHLRYYRYKLGEAVEHDDEHAIDIYGQHVRDLRELQKMDK